MVVCGPSSARADLARPLRRILLEECEARFTRKSYCGPTGSPVALKSGARQMVNHQTLQGHWNEIQGMIRKKWAQLTDEDLKGIDGDADRLIGMLQRKTGEARSNIVDFLDEITAEGASALGGMAEDIRRGMHSAADRMQESSQQAVDYVKQGYEEAQHMVRQRPSESVLVCFGVGLLA